MYQGEQPLSAADNGNKAHVGQPEKEEYNPLLLDQYQRFPNYLSCNRDILKPKVLEILIENGFDFEYPEGKKFAVCLTLRNYIYGH